MIGKILAKAQAMPSDQMDLIQAASDVTGEDIAKQLAAPNGKIYLDIYSICTEN